MFSIIKYVDLERLYHAGSNEASLIIRLMIACNDIMLANYCLSIFKEGELKGTQEHIRTGAQLYFVRLQASHLNESMHLIKELEESFSTNNNLSKIYNGCSNTAKNAFLKLKECLEGNSNRKEFMKNVYMIRNKVSFHYWEEKLFKKAIARRIKDKDKNGMHSKITLSDDIRSMRFNIADEIADTVVCRSLWNIEDDKQIRKEAGKRELFCYDLCVSFIVFCKEFIFNYIKEFGLRY